ncbi:CPBP family intramembrane glutamic endopeptidase [Paenibacillus sp. OAS669]|uniref:CPBP family intramembrane glutamic endopeptidase n=1 Tax=Paenibacillus sp. OAS669 TaxID=2663821 RepID=UPI00178BA867|nr:CPBP family intramembrane glutamic endopeptidase [Paenibacillus sp. OAS669]MBE1443845.1 hypothetical protein [Paenibacillus sp. OAS669]
MTMKTLLQPESPTCTLRTQTKRVTHPIAAVLLSFAFVLVSILLAETLSGSLNTALSGLEQSLVHQPAVFSAIAKILILWLLNVPIYLMLWGWLKWFERRPFGTLGFSRQGLVSGYLRGLCIGFLMISFATGIAVLLNIGSFTPLSGPLEGVPALGGIILVFLGWAVQASAEEVLYRGWLLQTISIRTNPWIGVLLSSLCFACVHGLNNGFSPLVLCNLFLFGLFLALYRIDKGSLWGVCAWHTVWNWALGNIYGAEVGGSAAEGGHLFHLQLTGSDWLTGGAFGLEGSIVTTTVFLIGIGYVSVMLRRRQWKERRSVEQANG